MQPMGFEISEDGRCEWRNNGGIIERRFLYTDNPQWETVADTHETPKTVNELQTFCEKGGFGYAPPENV